MTELLLQHASASHLFRCLWNGNAIKSPPSASSTPASAGGLQGEGQPKHERTRGPVPLAGKQGTGLPTHPSFPSKGTDRDGSSETGFLPHPNGAELQAGTGQAAVCDWGELWLAVPAREGRGGLRQVGKTCPSHLETRIIPSSWPEKLH